ncbi:MAG: DUF642 domain-containing protein [Gemmatimonadaceae bacterium]|jgi:hypothetical protein|nr:DUF642 domain-containing protein [Gemmatimonadaceae bacterium]
MHRSLSALLALALAASTAQSQVLFSDNFNSENGGNGALNYNSFANWTVNGQVDLVRSGDFGITCAGGSGSCVDLDGTSGPGTITLTNAIAVTAGQRYRFTFDVSGSQRAAAADPFQTALRFGASTSLTDVVGTGLLSFVAAPGPVGPSLNFIFIPAPIPGTTGWSTASLEFTVATNNNLRVDFSTSSADNVGPLIDNVSIARVNVVPEPSTYALLATGLAGVLVAARRRRDAR